MRRAGRAAAWLLGLPGDRGARRAILLVWGWRSLELLLVLTAGALLQARFSEHDVWLGVGGVVALVLVGVLLRMEPFSLFVRDRGERERGYEVHQ